MRNAELMALASTAAILPILRNIEAGRNGYAEYVLENLQDRGLIDHNDALTEKARELLSRSEQT